MWTPPRSGGYVDHTKRYLVIVALTKSHSISEKGPTGCLSLADLHKSRRYMINNNKDWHSTAFAFLTILAWERNVQGVERKVKSVERKKCGKKLHKCKEKKCGKK